MVLTRRGFLRSAAGALTSASAITNPAQASTTVDFAGSKLLSLSDGRLRLPIQFVLPESIDAKEKAKFLASSNLHQQNLEPDCNLALWKTEERVVLFDVGAGSNFMPSAGKLLDDLDAVGIDPTEVTDVVFTHAHPDHLWGLIDDFDELTFPEANYYMHAAEWDYWNDENTINTLPDVRKSFAVGAMNRFGYLAEQIQLFNYGDEVLPGIEAFDTHGHTPGHTSFAIHQGSESVLILGDALTHPVISFERAKWPSGSDQDQEAGRSTRLALLDRLAQDKMQILGFHLPHPGLGYVDRDGLNYRYAV